MFRLMPLRNQHLKINVDGKEMVMGGTTIVVPIWAGLIALINQGIGRNVGYINPLLYNKWLWEVRQ